MAIVDSIAKLRADAGGIVILEETPDGLLITIENWPPLADLRERPADFAEGIRRVAELNLKEGLSVWIKPLFPPIKFR